MISKKTALKIVECYTHLDRIRSENFGVQFDSEDDKERSSYYWNHQLELLTMEAIREIATGKTAVKNDGQAFTVIWEFGNELCVIQKPMIQWLKKSLFKMEGETP